jgi:hypothetical protein
MTSPRGETLYEFGEQLDYESIQSVAVVNDVSAYHKGLVPDDVVDFTEQVVDHIVVGFELTATLLR